MKDEVCRYCGIELVDTKEFDMNQRTIDHVKAQTLGGSNEYWNRVLCCRACNILKSSNISYEEFIAFKEHNPEMFRKLRSNIVFLADKIRLNYIKQKFRSMSMAESLTGGICDMCSKIGNKDITLCLDCANSVADAWNKQRKYPVVSKECDE